MLIILNVISFLIVVGCAAYLGWLGQSVQFKMFGLSINPTYDRELLLSLALVQAGKGDAIFTSSGMIEIHTENYRFSIWADDFSKENFGTCYSYYKNYGSWSSSRVDGNLTLKTRKYLLQFKEEFLKIKDPSTLQKPLFNLKKEKVTIQ